MGLPNLFPSIIHSASDADFNKYVYYQVYAGADTTAMINGQLVTLANSSLINLKIKSISGDSVYVLGSPMNSVTGSEQLGSTW